MHVLSGCLSLGMDRSTVIKGICKNVCCVLVWSCNMLGLVLEKIPWHRKACDSATQFEDVVPGCPVQAVGFAFEGLLFK